MSYPALLAVGQPATAANITNTAALLLVSPGGVFRAHRAVPDRDLVALYGGYFGAAAGVLMLALLLVGLPLSLRHGIADKNVLLGVAYSAAALGVRAVRVGGVECRDPAGVRAGDRAAAGPVLARRLPAEALGSGIGVAGLGLAVVLGLDAYARGRPRHAWES